MSQGDDDVEKFQEREHERRLALLGIDTDTLAAVREHFQRNRDERSHRALSRLYTGDAHLFAHISSAVLNTLNGGDEC